MRGPSIELEAGKTYLTKTGQQVLIISLLPCCVPAQLIYEAVTEPIGRAAGRGAPAGKSRAVGLAGFRKTLVRCVA